MNGTILGEVNHDVIFQSNRTRPNRNVFVVGGPGSYKTQAYVMTNVFNETENSIVVTDPKGELYEHTAAIKQAQGYEVHVINFANMAHSDRYNPLDYIRKDVDANEVATKIVASGNKDSKKDVWYYSQIALLKALILYVLNEREPALRNLKGVTEFLQANSVTKDQDGVSELDQKFDELEVSHPARKAYELGFKKSKGEMQSSIIMSLLTTIANFVDEEVAEFTSFSDFDLKDIGDRKVILYVIIPVMDTTFENLTNLFFTQMFSELYKLASDHHAHLPNEVDFLLDEFVNLGKFPKYEEFLATCRGYGIGVSTICQSLTQMQALYGKDKAESILGNNAVKICMNATNEATAEYFSDLLGQATVKVRSGSQSTSHGRESNNSSKSDSYNYTSRKLMTPDEIMQMNENQEILIFSNERPLKAKKTFQFKLFPGADHLVILNQNEYQGQASKTQLAQFKHQNEEWKKREAKLRAKLREQEVELEKQRQIEAKQAKKEKEADQAEFYQQIFASYQKQKLRKKQIKAGHQEEKQNKDNPQDTDNDFTL